MLLGEENTYSASTVVARRRSWRQRAPVIGAALGLCAVFAGAVQYDLLSQWHSARALELVAVLTVIMATGAFAAKVSRRPVALCIVVVHILLTTMHVGLVSMISVALLVAAGWSLGARLVQRDARVPSELKAVLGMALIGFAIGWTLPLPIHMRWLYLVVCVALIWPMRSDFADELGSNLARVEDVMRERPRVSTFAVLCLVAGSMPVWLPTLMYDDLAYHLALPTQLAELGRYRMDAGSQVWAFAPWLGDSLFAAVRVMAGEDSRGALNLMWLLLLAPMIFRVATRLIPGEASVGWWTIALYMTLPVTAVLAAGMQTELIGSVFVMAALLALLLPAQAVTAPSRYKMVVVALAALLAIKLSLLPCLLFLLAAFVWRVRGELRWQHVIALPALILLLGGSSYVYAEVFTGNPVLPLANALFKSPYFPPVNFADSRYQSPLDLRHLWALLFDSASYYESWRGVSGYQWLPLLVPSLVVMWRNPRLRWTAALAAVLVLLQYKVMAYLRYLHPFLLIGLPVMAAGALALGRRYGGILVMTVCVANLAYQANALWLLHNGLVFELAVQPWQRDAQISRIVPESRLMERVREQNPAAKIVSLDPKRPFVAGFAGHAFSSAWYDTELRDRTSSAGVSRIRHMLDEIAFTHVMFRDRADKEQLERMFGERGGELVGEAGGVRLWSIPVAVSATRDLYEERDLGARWLRQVQEVVR